MSIFNNIFQKREGTTANDASSNVSGGSNYAGREVQVNTPTSALSVAAFYRAVELRANTMSMLVMEYQKKNAQTHGSNYEMDTRAEGKRINFLLQVQPNPTMTWQQLIKNAEQQRIFTGNAYIYVERNELGEIKYFWLCTSGNYNINGHNYTIMYNRPGGTVSKTDVDSSDIIHIRNTFSNNCGLSGIPTLTYAKQALSLAATNDKLVKDTAAKGGRMKLILQEEKQNGMGLGRANQKELKKIAEQLNEDLAMDKDVLFLNNIAGVTQYSQNLQQQDISIIRSFSVREIARFMGVPAVMLMDDSNSSYKTPEAATQEFIQRTIGPLATDWEAEMNAKLLGIEGYPTHRYHFNDEYLMRLDPIGRANIGKTLLETGVKCVNELREEYDLPTIPNGDIHYISTNLAELGSDKLREPATPAGSVHNDTVGGEEGEKQ